jgi:hypothetical protein
VEMDAEIHRPEKIISKRRKISRFIDDETHIMIGKEFFFWI